MSSTIELLVLERALPATADCIAPLRRELGAALECAEVDEGRRYDIALVMTEAATNAVKHAYPPAPPGLLFVDVAVTARDLLLRVCDCGRGMQARVAGPGLGLGLAVMSRLADGLEIARNRTVPGTRVSAVFQDVADAEALEPALDVQRPTLWEYAARLKSTTAMLRDDKQALTARAQQALDLAERLRAERGR